MIKSKQLDLIKLKTENIMISTLKINAILIDPKNRKYVCI